MARKDRERVLAILPLLASIVLSFFSPSTAHARTAAEVLKDYAGLSGKERETKLIEGAKREGKFVYYGTTAIDHIKRVFDEFKKRYPFVTIGDYRSGSVNVYNKITTEARAKRFEVDVIDLEPGEVYSITKTGLIDPYLSPSRKGTMEDFTDREGYWTAFYHLAVALGYNTDHVKRRRSPGATKSF